MGVVHKLIKGVDKKTRGAVVRIADKGKSSYLRRPLHPRLFPLDDVKKEPESITEDVTCVKEGVPEPVQAENCQKCLYDHGDRQRVPVKKGGDYYPLFRAVG